MAETSNPLSHATFSFAIAAPMMVICGHGAELAFMAAVVSMLVDLDSSLSPSSRHQRALHTPHALAAALSLPPLFSIIGLDPCIAFLPAIAVSSHLLQDILSGEMELEEGSMNGLGGILFRPRLARALDIVSIPASLAVMLL